VCRGALGLDITLRDAADLSKISSRTFQINQIMGLQKDASAYLSRGPAFLDESQIMAEAIFQGIHRQGPASQLREKLIQDTQEGLLVASREQDVGGMRLQSRVDLGTDTTIIRDRYAYFNPKFGACCIDVLINGVPILARVSNTSFYTMISVTVVEELGLRRIERLHSNKFVDTVQRKKCSNLKFTCLEPITIRIGKIDVKLANAVEISPDPNDDDMFGVQLGSDFFTSALWCPIDVEVEAETDDQSSFLRIANPDGQTASLLSKASKSMIRYYSHDGRHAYVPLLHFGPFKQGTNHGISLRENVKFDQCFWCSRVFPEGMLVCEICHEATYCDERCQKAGWKCHKRLHSDVATEN